MLNVVWDMETQDPDDFLTLLLLLGHPAVHLEAITVTPGSRAQVGLVRRTLGWFGRDSFPKPYRPGMQRQLRMLSVENICLKTWAQSISEKVPIGRCARRPPA